MASIATILVAQAASDGKSVTLDLANEWKDVLEQMAEIGSANEKWLAEQLLQPVEVAINRILNTNAVERRVKIQNALKGELT